MNCNKVAIYEKKTETEEAFESKLFVLINSFEYSDKADGRLQLLIQ